MYVFVMAEKRQTTASKVKELESTVEDMRNTMSKINDSTLAVLAKMEELSQNTPVATATVHTPEVLALNTSSMDSKVIATNIEQAPIKTKGCFEILDALIEQFPNKVTVSAPHLKKDGVTLGKSYILNMPRIDETFVLVNKNGTTVAQQKTEAKGYWKAVAFNGYTFTGMYRSTSGGVFTTYIKQQNEAPFLEYLKKKGIHISAKAGNKPDEAGED